MRFNRRYDAFSSMSRKFNDIYPELSFIVNGIYIGEESKVELDTIFRFVVYFYDKNCPELQLHSDIIKAREAALAKFKIGKGTGASENFVKAENEMAFRYMIYGCDNRFNVFISLSIQLSNMLSKIREDNKSATWEDNVRSLKSSKDVVEISDQLDNMRRELFGDMKHIEQYAMQKELDSMFKAETAMI